MIDSLYVWFKLIHVVSALGFFGLQGVYRLRKHELHQATDFSVLRAILMRLEALGNLIRFAVLALLASGLFLVFTAWGWQIAWVNLSLGLFVVNLVLSIVVDQPWGKAIGSAAVGREGLITPEVRVLVEDKRLKLSYTLKTAVDLALVFLMTVKPGLWLAVSGAVLIITTYTVFATRQTSTRAPQTAKIFYSRRAR